MPKILVIVPFALDEAGVSNRREQLKEVRLAPDVAFDYRPVTAGPTSFMSPHDWALMDMAIFEAGLSAQDDGYDAVCIDTMSDSGMAALRSVLDIPVVSPGKASMLFALTLARNSPCWPSGHRPWCATARPFRSSASRPNALPCGLSTRRRISKI